MTELNKRIEGCEKINGGAGSRTYHPEDRALAIESAKEISFLQGAFDKLVETQTLLHNSCDRERGGLWKAVSEVKEKMGKANQQTAHTKGFIVGTGRSKKDLLMTITIIIAAIGIVANAGLLIYFRG